jgi:CheY-like chemotaxis protein/signal transduction histidine kinase/methyl-accepting chemotaxis protein
MKVLRNLKIRDKLMLLLVILLVPLIVFVAIKMRLEIEQNNELKEVSLRMSETASVSRVIHEFQKERARILAAVYDSSFYTEARQKRLLTDAAERDYLSFLEQNGRSFLSISLLNGLRKYRLDLDQHKLDVTDFQNFSNNLIFTFLDRIDDNASGISNLELRKKMLSCEYLIETKIQLSRMRSRLVKAIGEKKLSLEDYGIFISLEDSYNRAYKRFKKNASEETQNEVQGRMGGQSFIQTMNIIQNVEKNPANVASLNSNTVFGIFTESIEELRKSEVILIHDIQDYINYESFAKERGLVTLTGVILLILGLVSVLSFYIINLISSSLSALKLAADKVAEGLTDITIPVYGKDEIGNLADSFRSVIEKSRSLTQVAQAIGEGKYDVNVEVKSKEDILSNAIAAMKDNLSGFYRENERRNWILIGGAELNNLIGVENEIEKISEKIVSFLCSYTRSEAGVLFLNDDSGKLSAAACHGTKYSKDKIESFVIGLGKVGQAVADKKIIQMEAVQEEYLKIVTGLSEIDKANIIILPLIFSNNIIGAIELSARHLYGEKEIEFLENASERIAIVIHTLKTHLQTQELLHETQNQAEELETQQEELRQFNEELKSSEEELKVSQEELEEKNSELQENAQLLEEQNEAMISKNKSLEDARQAIEMKIKQVEAISRYKSEFLANMSHELRTPLNSILILSKLLADNKEMNLNAKQKEHSQIIHRSGSDLLKLINDILDLSKIESGQMKPELNDVNIKDIRIEDAFHEIAKSKNIQFNTIYAPDIYPTIRTDKFRLEQILRNFLSNAFKFTGHGGKVELHIYPVKDKSEIKSDVLKEQDEIIALSVRDTGVGIPEDKQSLVFEAFQQVDSSTTRKYGGTGLGLTISRELASLLGGEISLSSAEGKGSNFTLFLPRINTSEDRKTIVRAEPPVSLKPESAISQVLEKSGASDKKEISILIIEDDKGFNRILTDFALAKKFKVYQAFTGKEGFDLAKRIKPDAILLDINLPDISGWDILKRIREDENLRLVNVHVMSAYDKELKKNSDENQEYLPKPVTLEMLDKAFANISTTTDKSIETILIVEDNEMENKAVSELLLAHNIKSLSAYSAEEAEKILEKNKIDCIILDLNLPGMNGFEWMQKIRSKKAMSEIPIIIFSGKDLSAEEEMKIKKFANTIVIKNEYSYIRLLDEVQLFLNKVNQKLPYGEDFRMKLHIPEEVMKNKKVLVVDDDVRNVYSLFSLLESYGMEVIAAGDGKEALEKLETVKGIDIVLMDIMMPEMDGIEATKRIRQNYKFRDLPIIALTAKAMKGDKEKCMKAGASDYIPKPVDNDKLINLMRVWLYEG